jgi:hypothetical protein
VDETKDRGVGADPEGEDQDGCDREPRSLPQLADGETKIVHHLASVMQQPAPPDSTFSCALFQRLTTSILMGKTNRGGHNPAC